MSGAEDYGIAPVAGCGGFGGPLRGGHGMKQLLMIVVLMVLSGGCLRETQVAGEGTEVLSEDRWFAVPLELVRDAEVQVGLNLLYGPPVDVYFVDSANMNKWNTITKLGMSERELEFHPRLSLEGLSLRFTSEWCLVSEGRHYLIIDNSDFGKTIPPMNFRNDTSAVWYSISIK
jgi:hypothetical protein